MQHTLRLELHPWRSATRHKARPLLFVLMINDLQTKCDSYKYVDDTCIVYTGSDSQAPNLQEAADAAYLWTTRNDMKINKRKTKELVIDFSKTRTNFPTIRIDGTHTQRVTEAKILGITITSNLTWDVHVDEIKREKQARGCFYCYNSNEQAFPLKTF